MMRLTRMLRGSALVAITTLGACAISHADEIQMGQEYARQLNAQLPIVSDPETNRYLNLLGDSIARPADPRGLEWTFYLVNRAEVNAFAVPGGYVYVTRGLVERTDSMSQLAGVLAHEIAHVTRRHAVEQMEKAQQANVAVTIGCVLTGACGSELAQIGLDVGGAALFAKYSRDDEVQADEDAVTNVVRAGIDPRGIPQMFQKLIEERKQKPDAVSAWFSTHPTEEERVDRAWRSINALGPDRLVTLTRNSPQFRTFRARVKALPRPAVAAAH